MEAIRIKVKFHDGKIGPISSAHVGEWIDLSTPNDISMKAGEFKIIDLGVSIALPEGYEAILAPRSSTFKKYGLLQANGIGIIDCLYCGDDDRWGWAAYATRDIEVPANTHLCQFRIQKQQPKITIIEVDTLNNKNRGGFGSTGN